MAEVSQKLQLRANLISILNHYTTQEDIEGSKLQKDIEVLQSFQDKETIANVLFKELKNAQGDFLNICAIFILEVLDNDSIEKYSINFLKDKEIEDEKKFFISSLLKQKGIEFDPKELISYIKNPEILEKKGISSFLEDAINNLEIQIDLLDFYCNISDNEKIYLLNNLINEFKKEDLANVLSLIAQLQINDNELELITKGLLESDSYCAVLGLNFILENYKLDLKTINSIKNKILDLESDNKESKTDAIIKNSTIAECFIGFIDGRSEFSIVFSRKKENNYKDLALFTININKGIVSCMGFGNIPQQNQDSIIKRIYCDSLAVRINPVALKALFCHYEQKNKKTKTLLPYETIVWRKLLGDIKDVNYDISEFINSKLESTNLTLAKAKKFICSKMLETWYYSYKQNEKIDSLIDRIEKEKTIELEKINDLISSFIDNELLSDKVFIKELEDKLLIQSYVAHLANLKMSSSCAYSFCFKNPYLKLLITSIVDKSLYYYLSTRLLEQQEENKSLFNKEYQTNFTKEELQLIMSQLEEKWN